MQIIKRDGNIQDYSNEKIKIAIKKAFEAQESLISDNALNDIIFSIENEIEYKLAEQKPITVEMIQDSVEIELMRREYYKEVRAYILYREKHKKAREASNRIIELAKNKRLATVLKKIQKDYYDEIYDLSFLLKKYENYVSLEASKEEALDLLIKSSIELISKEAPKYEYIAGRFLTFKINEAVDGYCFDNDITSFFEKISYLVEQGYYNNCLLDAYTKEEIEELELYIDYSRDNLLTYSSINLLNEKYLIKIKETNVEKSQEYFMAAAMHFASKEEDKVLWAKKFYDVLSELKITIASPMLLNARRTSNHMSACFVDVVPDSLSGIYKSLDAFADVSKYGGGMGIYFGKVRAQGSEIKGINGNAAGVLKWVKLVKDTVSAVEEYGVRKGACTVYLDAWHKDLPDFLNINVSNEDNTKSSCIYPAICFPDLFFKMAKNNINGVWYLFCPHEIFNVKGYNLEDFYGNEWEDRYWDCIKDENISKVEIPIKDLLRLLFDLISRTNTPIIFNRDTINRLNPNKHRGIIYCSSLYGEVAQNTQNINDETIMFEENKVSSSGLASLNIGRVNVSDNEELKSAIDIGVRLLDNAVDLNNNDDAELLKYRSIGLGVIGYHHCLVKNGISYDSNEHLEFMNELFEKINFLAINASCDLAKEKGSYEYFKGSLWEDGKYFEDREYADSKWQKMRNKVMKHGLRNAYIMAISQASLSSVIAGTSKGCDPIESKFSVEKKNDVSIVKVAPELNNKTFWLYKNVNDIDSEWIIKACSVRQKHIDQSEAMTLYVEKECTYSKLLTLFINAWSLGIKTFCVKLI